jgi:hypothetical protein
MSHEAKENEFDNYDQVLKGVIFEALRAANITEVQIEFEGNSDDGQFEEIAAFRDGAPVDFPELRVVLPDDDDGCDLKEAIATICCDLLEDTHAGWEINEGSYGEFRLDVVNGTFTLEFNGRYIEVETETHRF